MRHFERLIARLPALIVFAVAQDHHRAAEFVARLVLHQLIAAREKNRVVQRRAAARPQAADRRRSACRRRRSDRPPVPRAVSKLTITALIFAGRITVLTKSRGGFLLELEAVANAVAGVDQNRQAQRQFGFRRELDNRLRLLRLENLEVSFFRLLTKRPFLSETVNRSCTRVTSKSDCAFSSSSSVARQWRRLLRGQTRERAKSPSNEQSCVFHVKLYL